MKRAPDRRRSPWALPLTFGLFAAWVTRFALACGPAHAPLFEPPPVSEAARDLAVGCLAWGRTTPALDALTDDQLGEVVPLVARLQESYARADFEAFLALRRHGLEHARSRVGPPLDELRLLTEQLGVADVPDDWAGALRAFWDAYYAAPPVARWRPEATRLAVAERELGPDELVDWRASFERFRDALPFGMVDHHYVDHRLVLPHPRPVERLALRGSLRWLDLVLGFDTPHGAEGRLLARFVHDPIAEEWFLQRAATSLRSEAALSPDVRQLLL